MANNEPGRTTIIPVWGIFLLFLGIIFLLQTFNVLPWGLWGTLWRFWPVIIIVIGLSILLRGINGWLASLIIVLVLGAGLGIAIWQYGPLTAAGQTTSSYSQPLNTIQQARVDINFDAGSMNLVSLLPGSADLVSAESTSSGGDGMKADFNREGSEGRLTLSTQSARRSWFPGNNWLRWEVELSPDIPLTLNVKSAASETTLRLGELEISNLRLDVSAGSAKTELPPPVGTVRAEFDVSAGNLEITIPPGVAARIKTDISLGDVRIDQSRFPRQGDYYVSPGWDSSANRLDLEIKCSVGRAVVN